MAIPNLIRVCMWEHPRELFNRACAPHAAVGHSSLQTSLMDRKSGALLVTFSADIPVLEKTWESCLY